MKLFLKAFFAFTAMSAFAPEAFGETLYFTGGIKVNGTAQVIQGAGNGNFNDPANWSTVPPNTFQTGGTNGVPSTGDIAVVQADVNNGSVFYTSANSAFINFNPLATVMLNQTTTANTVRGFLISNYGFFGVGSGTIQFNNTSNQPFTVNGTNAVGGDFVVDGGTTLNYQNGPFVVSHGLIVIGDPELFSSNANNTQGGPGTFNIQSGSFTFDATGQGTSMIVGNGTSTGGFFGVATGVVSQGTTTSASTAVLGSSLILGYNGATGSWSVTNGSTLSTGTLASSYLIAVGANGSAGGGSETGSLGTLTIASGSTLNLGTVNGVKTIDLQVGTVSVGALAGIAGGTGSIVQADSGTTVNIAGTATSVELGSLGGGTGTYLLQGGTLNIGTNATDVVTFAVGSTINSSGTLTQSGGTLVEGNSGVTNGTTFSIGGVGTGTYTINGGTATFNNGITLGANGTINLNGGTLNVAAAGVTGTGSLNFGGGTLKLISGTTFAESFAGGALADNTVSTIDASTGAFTTVAINQTLHGAGGLNFIGTTGTIFSFNGTVGSAAVMGGTLNVTAANIANSTSLTVLSNGASPGILNLDLGASSLTYGGTIGGNGTFNINFNGANETFSLTNTNNVVSSLNFVLAANTGPGASTTPGTLQLLSGTFGNISENGVGNGVTIGTNAGTGTVSIGNATYTGLTTVNANYTLLSTKLVGDVSNAGNLAVSGAGAAGGIGGDVTNSGLLVDSSDIGGTLMNTGTVTVAGTNGIAGDVTNSGMLSTTHAAANVTNSGTFIASSSANTVGGDLTNSVGGVVITTAALPTTVNTPSFTVGGNLTSPGTLTVRLGNGVADQYQVGGNANLDNGTIQVQIQAGGKIGLTTYTIVTAAGVSDAGTLLSPNTALFSYTLVNNGTSESLLVQQSAISVYAQTPNQAAVAAALDGSSSPLFSYFGNIPLAAGTTLIPAALEQLSPESLQYSHDIAFENANLLAVRMSNVDADLRGGYGGLDTNAISVVSPSFNTGMGRSLKSFFASADSSFHKPAPNGVNYYSGGANGAPASAATPAEAAEAPEQTFSPDSQLISDTPNPYMANQHPSGYDTPRTSEFIGGDVVLAELNQDSSAANAPSSKASYAGGDVVAGVSYRVTPHFAAGVLFDYNHTEADVDNSGSKVKVDSYSPGLFGTWFDHGFYVNGLAAFGYNNYSNTRDISFLGQQASSNPSGQQYIANVDGGYDFHPNKNWVVGPTLGVTYTHLDVDSFSETGAPGADLNVDSQSVDSLRSRFGGHVVFQTNTGDVLLQPNLSIMWQHEFLDNSSGMTSSFSDFSASSFTINTIAPSRDSALISLGLTATLSNSMALYLNYLADVGADSYWAQSVVGGFKARF